MRTQVRKLIRSLIGIKSETDYFSQAGEDAIVSKLFNYVLPVERGTYVDIGAYHPFKHSNTYILYRSGWRGVNVDPNPVCKALFDKHRPDDLNVSAGVGAENSTMTYYILGEDSTMNSFSRENLEKLGLLDSVKRTIEVPVLTLDSIFEKYASTAKVDYLNIDAEGYEMEILSRLGSCPTRPDVISLEQNGVRSLKDVLDSEACRFLASHDYSPVAKNILLSDIATVFYVRNGLY